MQPVQVKLTWKKCTDLPFTGGRIGQATVINNRVYYGGFATSEGPEHVHARTVFCYDPSQDVWSTLTKLSIVWFHLGQIQGWLVAVGGRRVPEWIPSNDVYLFDERSKKWKTSIPPMPTARWSPDVIGYHSVLIVAGGFIGSGYVDTVEVFDAETSKWYKTDSLPIPCCHMSPVMLNDKCYAVGGIVFPSRLKQVLCASVEELLHNQSPHSAPVTDHISAWKKLADAPTYGPNTAAIADVILCIGGIDKPVHGKPQTSVYMYSPSSDSWIYIADLPAPRYDAAIAVLSPTEFLVIGGLQDVYKDAYVQKTAYKGTLSL